MKYCPETFFVFLRGAAGLFSLVLLFSSCATPIRAPVSGPGLTGPVLAPPLYPQPPMTPRQDIVHIVAPGETFWRIGKMYDVPADDVARANRLSLQDTLQKGDQLKIPHAAPVQPVISLYPSDRWKNIIIHHSATDQGDSLLFDKVHSDKGWEGIGYHFVISNGSRGRVDGQIEVSPRWLKQVPGAHCKADHMNERAIGICLVGNFNNGQPTRRQMDSLVFLVKTLSRYYRIPSRKILGHGQVEGAQTDCPGTQFPWDMFSPRMSRN